jgi:hypothetical protein
MRYDRAMYGAAAIFVALVIVVLVLYFSVGDVPPPIGD